MGSVKDIITLPEDVVLPKDVDPEENYKGADTSDRFSIFDLKDYILDTIPLKGLALAMMAGHDFEVLQNHGFRTHYIGMLDPQTNKVVRTTELKTPSKILVFREYDFHDDKVIFQDDGTYDYSFFEKNRGALNKYVILLEFVFRMGAPEGSSLFRKTIPKWQEEGDDASIQDFLRRTGLEELPKPGDLFPNTIYDFWTKAEKEDRRLGDDGNYEEALRISGLTKGQFLQVLTYAEEVPEVSANYLDSVGLELFDGKREFAWDDGPDVIDFPATLDEDRWLRRGRQISKEFPRLYMEKKFQEFYEHMIGCKNQAEKQNIEDFRTLLTMPVPRFPQEILDLVGKLYTATADVVLQGTMFNNLYGTPKLDDLLDELDEVNEELAA